MSTSVSVSVCLSVRISPEPHAPFFQIFVHVAHGPGSVLLWQGDKITRGRDNFGVFFPVDNALYSTAFRTHTKRAERIEMPFGMMTGLGPRNSVLRGVTIPEGEGALLGQNMCSTSLSPRWTANCIGPCSGVHRIGADA